MICNHLKPRPHVIMFIVHVISSGVEMEEMHKNEQYGII